MSCLYFLWFYQSIFSSKEVYLWVFPLGDVRPASPIKLIRSIILFIWSQLNVVRVYYLGGVYVCVCTYVRADKDMVKLKVAKDC